MQAGKNSFLWGVNIFYCPDAILNEECTLDENESGHITRVLRKKVDEELYVFDGKGSLFDARIVSIGKKQVNARISTVWFSGRRITNPPCILPLHRQKTSSGLNGSLKKLLKLASQK